MNVRRIRRAWVFGALCLVTLGGIGADAADAVRYVTVEASTRHRPVIIRQIREGVASSLNWSGYAVAGSKGSVQDVSGSWVVPSVTCDSGTEYSSFWVGIDGFNSNTVEQIGTDADCHSGAPAYYAWFELYPHPMFTINTLPVNAGDVMSANVHYDPRSRQFTVTITNQTANKSFSTSARVNNAQRSSAEWIAEAPWSAGGVLPLADFGTVSYSGDMATVNDTTGVIGAFGTANVYSITMVDNGGNAKAVPSTLTSGNSSFSVQWMSAGP
jgi:Peptidase A4 family